MSKYDLKLDLASVNSTSLVIDMLEPDASILEFGPAHGRLTKYLKEEMNCLVDIVEIDQASGEDAGKYADLMCIGEKYGDANQNYWVEYLKDRQYDYIIFEDVLEHLVDPEKVLKNAVDKLKDEGSIVVSIPNVAHSAIIVQLFNNEFMYQPLGLLDNTHIRLFTYHSFKKMITGIGLESVEESATFSETSNTEFPVSLFDVPREVAKALLNKDFANVYQFIFKLQKKNKGKKLKELKDEKLDLKTKYFVQCYWRTTDEFNEEESVKIFLNPNDRTAVRIPINTTEVVKEIRIDPLNTNCGVSINKIKIITSLKEEIPAEDLHHNGRQLQDTLILFTSEDPQIFISNQNDREISEVYIELDFKVYDVDYIDSWDLLFESCEGRYRNNFQSMEVLIKEKDTLIGMMDTAMKEKDTAIDAMDAAIQEKNTAIDVMDTAIKEKNTAIDVMDTAIKEKDTAIGAMDAAIKEKDMAIDVMDAAIKETDTAIDVMDAAIKEKDMAIGVMDAAIKEKDTAIDVMDAAIKEKDMAISVMDAAIKEKDMAIGVMDAVIKEKDDELELELERKECLEKIVCEYHKLLDNRYFKILQKLKIFNI